MLIKCMTCCKGLACSQTVYFKKTFFFFWNFVNWLLTFVHVVALKRDVRYEMVLVMVSNYQWLFNDVLIFGQQTHLLTSTPNFFLQNQ